MIRGECIPFFTAKTCKICKSRRARGTKIIIDIYICKYTGYAIFFSFPHLAYGGRDRDRNEYSFSDTCTTATSNKLMRGLAFPCEYVIRIRVAGRLPREYRSRVACHFIMFVSRSIDPRIAAPFTGKPLLR